MHICYSLQLWMVSETLIISFCTCRLSSLCILHSWRWQFGRII